MDYGTDAINHHGYLVAEVGKEFNQIKALLMMAMGMFLARYWLDRI